MAQQQAIHKFVLGSKELEGKVAEFGYDRGWYSITDIVGETREVIYRSRNAQEAYTKWNVYIGRKKERPIQEERPRSEKKEGAERSRDKERGGREGWDSRKNRGDREKGAAFGSREERQENRGNRNRNRQNRDNYRGERPRNKDQGSREARRDRRRNRSDRSRRDRESAGQD